MKKSSIYFGVSRTSRTARPWQVVVRLASKDRKVGYYETELEAARASDNVRVHLQEYLPSFPKLNLTASQVGPELPVAARLRDQLQDDGAQTYDHEK